MDFEDVIGNEEVKKYLSSCIQKNSISQSYLFVGTEGIGKLLIAKAFAKKILCLDQEKKDNCQCKSCGCFNGENHADYFVVNENGETIKIEKIREITSKVIEAPIISNRKVYIINDCEKMTVEAQNCLLKTLEEPPEFVVMILVSANENAILNTIKSRCMTIKFEPISKEELKKYAMDKLGYEQMSKNLLNSLSGSIGKAILQKEKQVQFLQIETIVNDLETKDIITIMNQAKVIYDKENISSILEYLMICVYAKIQENKAFINCIEKINHAINNLKRNCNFDMTLDTMLFEMWETVRKGM